MAKTVAVELPDWVLDAVGVPEDRLAQELRKGLAVVLYVGERVSLREAAGLAGMSYADFMEYLGFLGLGIPYGVKEFEEDQATLRRLGLL